MSEFDLLAREGGGAPRRFSSALSVEATPPDLRNHG
jgi:hypothetical protein